MLLFYWLAATTAGVFEVIYIYMRLGVAYVNKDQCIYAAKALWSWRFHESLWWIRAIVIFVPVVSQTFLSHSDYLIIVEWNPGVSYYPDSVPKEVWLWLHTDEACEE